MTSNIKKRPDYVRLFLAISSILVFVVLLFTAFNGLGFKVNLLGSEAMKGFDMYGIKTFSLSIFDLMTGVTDALGPIVVNGLRAAGFMLTLALIIAGVIVFGIISKRFSYKTLKILAISNAVLLVLIGVLVLLTKQLIAAEVVQIYPEFTRIYHEGDTPEESYWIEVKDFVETLKVNSPAEFIYKYFGLGWGAIACGTTAIVAAGGYVGTLIYAKHNKLEI